MILSSFYADSIQRQLEDRLHPFTFKTSLPSVKWYDA